VSREIGGRRVSDPPPEIPRVTIRNFCVAVYAPRAHVLSPLCSRSGELDADPEAVLASLSHTVFAPYARLRAAVGARDTHRRGVMASGQLLAACQEAGFADWDEADATFVLRVFHAEQASMLEWEPFLMAVALAVHRTVV
jgi:hypothetical protein